MREQLVSGDVAARKAYLSAIVDAIVVSDTTIPIIGSNDNIRATLGPDGQPATAVRKSVQEWCGWSESNRHSSRNRILKESCPSSSAQPHELGTRMAHISVAQHLPGT
jgi:site-specific DNA recombinase